MLEPSLFFRMDNEVYPVTKMPQDIHADETPDLRGTSQSSTATPAAIAQGKNEALAENTTRLTGKEITSLVTDLAKFRASVGLLSVSSPGRGTALRRARGKTSGDRLVQWPRSPPVVRVVRW